MTKRVYIRYSAHQDKEMVGRNVSSVAVTNKSAENVRRDLNIFFAGEGLPYYAAISEEGEIKVK